MDQEDRRIYLLAQIALFNAKIAAMQAENQFRLGIGETIAYGEEAFISVIAEYEDNLGHDAVITYLTDPYRHY